MAGRVVGGWVGGCVPHEQRKAPSRGIHDSGLKHATLKVFKVAPRAKRGTLHPCTHEGLYKVLHNMDGSIKVPKVCGRTLLAVWLLVCARRDAACLRLVCMGSCTGVL